MIDPFEAPLVTTALVTPFRDGKVDEAAVPRLVARQVVAGVDGLLVASQGAGEAATLTRGEFVRLVECCIEAAGSRAKVIAEVSSNATESALDLVLAAEAAGAHAVLAAVPWYNKPSQLGILRHFQAITAAAQLPVLIANRPQQTNLDIDPETLVMLTSLPNVAALVEGSSDVARITVDRACCPGKTETLAASETVALGALAHGATGIVSVTANLAPRQVVAMAEAATTGQWRRAREANDGLFELHQAVHADAIPAAVKFVLGEQNVCQPDLRLPLTPCGAAAAKAILSALRYADGLMQKA